VDLTIRNQVRGLVIGLLILGIGTVWCAAVIGAGSRNTRIQHGDRATAVVDSRRFIAPCLRFTCRQTEYRIRYVAAGRVFRATVVADEWERSHPPGTTLSVVYRRDDPGRVEIAGHAASRTLDALGAILALTAGLAISAAWLVVIVRRRPRRLAESERDPRS
jgi:hypothetical protein